MYRRLRDLSKAIAAMALVSSSLSAEAACAPDQRQSISPDQRTTIALQSQDRKGPVYYWHDSATYTLLYFRPEDLVKGLEALMARDSAEATLLPALLDNIKVDLPLKESMDLFRYSLIDQRFDTAVNAVIADLMKDGRVMLDQWVFDDGRARSIEMVSRTDPNGEQGGLWFCTSKDDVLFKTGYILHD